jgi:hypothetical protein
MLALVSLTLLAGLFALVFNLRAVLDASEQVMGQISDRLGSGRRAHRRIARARYSPF